MIDYEAFQKIKHLHKNMRLNVSQIANELGLSRPAIRRHLAKEKYEAPKRAKRSSKLDPYKDTIKRYLNQHEYTAVQIFQMISEDGYTGQISNLRAYIALIRPSKQPAYLTLTFAPGEAAQVDFGYCGSIQVGNIRRRLYVFAMTLCYSRMIYVEFILRQNMEHFLQCHRNAIEYFGGIPEKVMVDNCKVAISSVSQYGGAVVNAHYADLASHYNFEVVACGVRRPNEKGRVERTIGYLKQNFLNGLEKTTLTALSHSVRNWMENIANPRIHGSTKKQPIELFKAEKEAMKALPLFPYDCCVTHNVKANSQYRVVFESNRYSVPPELARKSLTVKVYPSKLLFMYQDKLVAEHQRCYEKNKDSVDAEHDKALIEKRHLMKNHRLLGRFFSMGEIAEKYDRGLAEKRCNPRRHIRQITALLDIYDDDEVKKAMEDTGELGVFSADAVLNVLEIRHRSLPEPTPLHLSRKTDCLDIELPKVDLDIYNIE